MDNGGTEYKEMLAVVERAWPVTFFSLTPVAESIRSGEDVTRIGEVVLLGILKS